MFQLSLKRPLMLFFLMIVCMSVLAAPKNERLEKAKNYILYYGAVGTKEVDILSKYDVVIIDPQAMGAQAKEHIATLKKRGCLVIGYLSCMEIADWHRYRNQVPEEWLLRVNGNVWIPWGNNRAVDLTRPEWRKLLVELIRSELIDYGCEGVFMDTLADIEHPQLPEALRVKQLEGLDALMSELRTAHGDFILVGNWTIQATLPVMAKYADVICWENFQAKYFRKGDEAFEFAAVVRKNLDAFRKKHHFKVYALWAAPAGSDSRRERIESAKSAKSFGYLFYSCTGDYHAGLEK